MNIHVIQQFANNITIKITKSSLIWETLCLIKSIWLDISRFDLEKSQTQKKSGVKYPFLLGFRFP